ncbi:MAG: cation:proton antiporter [Clostridia bacterium]|nr:cation:proton antiporter [Clostridia bacterium]
MALISDLAIILLTAGVVTVLFKKINQPLVLGYILSGFLIGPYMPLFFSAQDTASIETWSEIGIIVLMFSLGLEFSFKKLVSVGGGAVITAMTVIAGMLTAGYATGMAMGWPRMDAIFLGGMLSMSSTTIIIKAFSELGVEKEPFAGIVFGTLVVEDIAGIFMMIILSTISVSKNISGADLAMQLSMLVLYLVIWFILGIYFLPSIMRRGAKIMTDETLLIVSLGICFGMVLLAEKLGFSSALGAFLAGSLLAGTIHAERVEHITSSIKDLFGTVFFISVGMMIDPAMVVTYKLPILIISAVVILGQTIFSTIGVLLAGHNLKTAVQCGMSLAQVGEFAFIIASLGISLGVTSNYLYPIIVSVSVLTTLTTPYCIKGAGKVYELLQRALPGKFAALLNRDESGEAALRSGSAWTGYLKRYLRITFIYGALMMACTLFGHYLLLPLLSRVLQPQTARIITLIIVYLGIAMFIRPFLDLHSFDFTKLWVQGGAYKAGLMVLTGIRVVVILLIAFIPLHRIAGASGYLFLPAAAAALFLASRSGWLASRYLNAEARFMANLNERNLEDTDAVTVSDMLDERLHVGHFTVFAGYRIAGKTLKELGWGKRYDVNIIKLIRQNEHLNMPDGDVTLQDGDEIYVIGESDNISTLYSRLGGWQQPVQQTLREYMEEEESVVSDLYSFPILVDKSSPLAGKTIRDCGLRRDYDCMILGLQRSHLPIPTPDIHTVIAAGDQIWVLGTQDMADKLIAAEMVSRKAKV